MPANLVFTSHRLVFAVAGLLACLAASPSAAQSVSWPAFGPERSLPRLDGLTDALPDYKALSHQLIDDVVYIPLYYATSVLLIKPYLRGAGANNLSDLPWSGIEIVAH